jgi:hypothetical protein
MKKILALIFIAVCPLMAQNSVSVSYTPAYSLYNSENGTKTIGPKHVGWIQGLSVGYENDNIWEGFNLDVEYNYLHYRANGVQTFIVTDESDESVGSFGADLHLNWHSVDIDANRKFADWFSVSVGPSVSYVGRGIQIDDAMNDRLQSLCFGGNGSLNADIPLQEGDEYLFLFAHAKVRYLHSIWFDARGRKLEDYHQSFLQGQINVGVGYRF